MLVLDEATSSLSEAATERLLERLEQLRDRGVAIVFISHRLREIYQLRSRVDRAARRPADRHACRCPQTGEHALVRMMVGREIDDLFNKRRIEQRRARARGRRSLTTDDGIGASTRRFEVRAGEIVGVAGLVGCGKSELALALGGASAPTGEIARARRADPAALAARGDRRRDRLRPRGPQAQRDPADALGPAQPLGRLDCAGSRGSA